jgi:hypothetical protein
MPTAANSSRPKIQRMKVDRDLAKLINDIQALMLTGKEDSGGETSPELDDDEED